MKHKKGANTSQKILLWLFIIVAVMGVAIVFSPLITGKAVVNTNCQDSDAGIIRLVKGTVSGIDANGRTYSYTDVCTNTKTLTEYYCYGNNALSKSITCSTEATCSNGACSGRQTINGIHVGSGIDVNGMSTVLENVGSGGDIIVNVEGIRETIAANSEEIVNCVLVKNIATYYTDNKNTRQALIDVSQPLLPDGTACAAAIPHVNPNLYYGEYLNFKGKKIVLDNVGSSGQAVITVNGVQETLSLNSPEVIDNLEITLEATTYTDNTAQRRATLNVIQEKPNNIPGPFFSLCYPSRFATTPELLPNVQVVVGQSASSSDTFAALDAYNNLQLAMTIPCSGVVPSFPEPVFLTDADIHNAEQYNLIIVGTEGANNLIPKYKLQSNYPYGSIQFVRNGDNIALLIIGKTDAATRDTAIALRNLNNVSYNTNVLCVSEDKSVYPC